jgi:hypothetical protein
MVHLENKEEENRMEHTPGLWIKDRNTIEDQTGKEIATISYRQSGYVQANAHLIAAAPELLEACRWAVNHFTPADNPMPDQIKAREVELVKALRAAIAKAKGG